jgi:nucleotide-binding universal stress UspA family protein
MGEEVTIQAVIRLITDRRDPMTAPEHAHMLVPVASVADAERTCDGLDRYLDDTVETVTVVHVIEQRDGYLDPASPTALEREAERLFAYVEEYFDDAPEIRRSLRYGTDAVEEIVAAADELDVSAIGFVPRPKNRIEQLLTENTSYRLVTESHHPVVAFSKGDER